MSDLFPNEIDLLCLVFAREQSGQLSATDENFSVKDLKLIERLGNQGFLTHGEILKCPLAAGGYAPHFRNLRLTLSGRRSIALTLSLSLHPTGLLADEISLLARVLESEQLLDAPEDLFNEPELMTVERLHKQGFVDCDGVDRSFSATSSRYIPRFRALRLSLAGRRVLKTENAHFASIPSASSNEKLFGPLGNGVKRYDLFISHAWEDKEEVARPLAKALEDLGFQVWYDEITLKIGDSLRGTIDRGLSASNYGIVILSKAFFAKRWPQYELDGLMARENSNRKVILPLWHKLSVDEVTAHSPMLAGRVAAQTTQLTISQIAEEIRRTIT